MTMYIHNRLNGITKKMLNNIYSTKMIAHFCAIYALYLFILCYSLVITRIVHAWKEIFAMYLLHVETLNL